VISKVAEEPCGGRQPWLVWIALIDVKPVPFIVSLTQLNDIATNKGRAEQKIPHGYKLRVLARRRAFQRLAFCLQKGLFALHDGIVSLAVSFCCPKQRIQRCPMLAQVV
jgi:hypothetical protein